MIATRNRRDSLLRTLERLDGLRQLPPVVVVDNASVDGTAAAVRGRHPGALVLQPGHDLGGSARTLGVLQAETPYVAFSDDDSWWAEGALERAAALLARCPRLGLVAARVLVEPEAREDPLTTAMAAATLGFDHDLPGPNVLGFRACGAVLRRRAFLAVGGFHPRLGVGAEEELLSIDLARAGWGLAYVRNVVAYRAPSQARDRERRLRVDPRNRLLAAAQRRPTAVPPDTERALSTLEQSWLSPRGVRCLE